ncbi:MAG: hypothetical protein GC159_18835 [Phycisphaera sp.]|nr:hypothetical protein [Phycisphaera sp.]
MTDRPTHNFAEQPDGDDADRFVTWLQEATIASLTRSYGDVEGTKAAIFLYVSRAHEAHMPDGRMAGLFGRCVVDAGYSEEEDEAAFAWLEHFHQTVSKPHRDS